MTAYESLPADLRDPADRLRIVHTNDHDYAAVYGRGERVDPAVEAAQQEFLSRASPLDLPVPLLPRSGSRPSWNQNSSVS